MKPVFWKMSGSGNDFIIIDNRDGKMDSYDLEKFIPAVCARNLSVGADGIFLIENCGEADFQWRFYNSDASEAEMCGNGARCAARFAYLNGIAGKKMRFKTLAGMIEAEIKEDPDVKVLMTPPFDRKENIRLNVNGSERELSFINTGVPHACLLTDDIENFPLFETGRAVRYHEYFAPKGTNFNVYGKSGENCLRIRTYERGVEGETLACGTGSVACAVFAASKKMAASPVTVISSSGIRLKVYLEDDGRVYLEGEARVIYTAELCEESYKY
jgi:diaminopimelate epimerase